MRVCICVDKVRDRCSIEAVTVPAEYVDAVCVVLERRQLSAEHLQSLQDFAIFQILEVLLLQQQELHTLWTHETDRRNSIKAERLEK